MKNGNLLLVPALLLLAGASQAQNANVPGDFETIQEAIDAAAAGDFDTITVGKGIFRENLVITTDGLTLKGKGKGTIVDGAYAGTVLDVAANDVTITNMVFANGGPATDGGGDPPPEGTGEAGGILYTGSGAVISKTEVRHSVSWGIKLVGTGDINDNLIVGTLGPGLLMESGDTAGPLTTVRNNQIVRNLAGLVGSDGPFRIEKNTVGNNDGDAISLSMLSADSNGLGSSVTTLSKNKIGGNSGAGILLVDEIGSTTLIEKNDLETNGVGMDLSGSGFTVSKNEIDLSLQGGLLLKTSDATFDKNEMRRSILVGVLVQTAPGATDGSNTFTNNDFQTAEGDGVIVESSLNVFEDNLITDNLGDGISIVGGASANQLIDNTVKENGHDGIDNSGTDTLISDNLTKDNLGADLAGIGDGTGTVDVASEGNVVGDESGLEAEQELELDTLSLLDVEP